MNIINKFFLYIVLLPSAMYEKMGVSVPHLKAILQTKLMMDDRRPNSLQQVRRDKKGKPIRFATIGTMLYTALIGCFFLVSFGVGNDDVTKFTFYFSFFIFMLTAILISDFTSVLIDVRDNMIILPKPVNDKTFVLGRLLHIVIHITKMILPMSIPGLITVGIMYSWLSVLPMFVILVAAVLFTIFIINALYIFILKVTTPEKFKSIISYFQIFFGIFVYASYQILPRMMNRGFLGDYTVTSHGWIYFLPTFWFAKGWVYLHHGIFLSANGWYFLLSILLPIVSIWTVITYFAPAFNQKLSMISGSSEGAQPVADKISNRSKTKGGWIETIAGWTTKRGAERVGFLLTWKITARSRDFKMKVYPTIGYMVVYFALIFLTRPSGVKNVSLRELSHSTPILSRTLVVMLIYMSCFVLIVAVFRLMYSDKFKAAWIYYITPVAEPGKLIEGSVKSAIVKFCLPIQLVVSILAVLLLGIKSVPNLVLGISNVIFIVSCIAYLSMRHLPFSQQESSKMKKGSTVIRSIFSMLLPLMIGAIHFMIYNYTAVVVICGILSIIACWLILDTLGSKSWEKLQMAEFED